MPSVTEPGVRQPDQAEAAAVCELRDLGRLGYAAAFAMQQEFVMTWGGYEFNRSSRYRAIRKWSLNHMVHHRGQLSVYLRLNDAKVPGVYGPSADEQ